MKLSIGVLLVSLLAVGAARGAGTTPFEEEGASSLLSFTGHGFAGKNGEISIATRYENGKNVVCGIKFRDGAGYNDLFWGGLDPAGKWCAQHNVRDQVMMVDKENESIVVTGTFKKGEKNPELPFYQRLSRSEDGRRVRLEIRLGDEKTPAKGFNLSLIGFFTNRQFGDARERYIEVNGKRVDLSWVEEKECEKRQFVYWSKDVKKGDSVVLDMAADRSILGYVPVECPHICILSLYDKSQESYDRAHIGFEFTSDAHLILEFDLDRTPSKSTKGYIVRGIDFAPAGFRMPDYSRSRNLLLNGSFEEGFYFWQLDSWGMMRAKANPHPNDYSYQIVEDDAVDGRRALRWRVYPGTHHHLSTYALPVTPQKTYTLSFWAKTDLPGTPNFFLAGWSQAYGPHIEAGRFEPLTKEWKRYTKTYVAPNKFFRLSLVPMDVTTEGHIWLDRVQLVEGEEANDVAVDDPGFVLETAHKMNWCDPSERLGGRVRFQSVAGGEARIRWNVKDLFRRVVRKGKGAVTIPKGHMPVYLDLPELEGLESGTYALEMTLEGFGKPVTRYFRFTLMPKLPHDFKHRFLFNATLFYGSSNEVMARIIPFWADAGIGSVVAFYPPDKDLYENYLKPQNIVPCGCAFDTRIDSKYAIENFYGKYNLVRTAKNGFPSIPDSERELFVKHGEEVARRYPHVKWWKTINEPLYSDEDGPHVARVLRWTAEGLKRGNPEAIVLTPDPGALDENVRKIWDAGCKEFCDYPAVHPYREHPEDPDLDANIQTLREWFPGKKVLFTEGNYFTCLELPANSCTAIGHGKALGSGDANRLGQFTADIGIGELAGTAHAMRYRLQVLKNADFVLMDNDWGCSDSPEAFMGADLIPTARIFAVNTLGKLLGNANFVTDILFGEPIRCYLFEDEMKRPVAVIWNYHKEIFRNPRLISSLDWKGMTEPAEVFNLVGAHEKVPENGLLPITGAPLFLRGKAGRTEAFKKALMVLDMVGGEVPDFRVEKIVKNGELNIALINIRAREVKGHLKFVADWKVVTEEDVVLPPQGKHVVKLPLTGQFERKKHQLAFVFEAVGKDKVVKEFSLDDFCIKEMPRGTKADGDLKKWEDAPAISLPTYRDIQPPTKSKWFSAPLFREGDADLSARIKAKWAPDGLYLLVDVTDDVYSPHEDDDVRLSYLGDGIQLYIDTFGDGVNSIREQYDPDDQVYQIRCRDGKTIECWREREPWKQYAFTKQGPEPRIGGTFTRTETGWRMDLKLPLEALPPIILEKGRAIGLSVLVNDNDGDYRKRSCYLSEGSEPMGRPNTWPLMILE